MLLNPFRCPNEKRVIHVDSFANKRTQTPNQNDANHGVRML